jgi:glycosyltransferase involved in cell wall biosynthesis
MFPDLAAKFTYIPYFLPHLTPLTDEALARKCADDIVRIVFVGRHARRKGLDLFLQAAEIARLNYRSDVEIVVVSALDDGVIPIPTWPNLHHFRGLPRSSVMGLLEKAHVLVMPSRFESYGIAYLEAMAKAAIPVVPNWEVQSELVDYGQAGVAVPLDPTLISHSLIQLIDDVSYRHALAYAAVARVKKEYAPPVVANLYANALRACCSSVIEPHPTCGPTRSN